MRQLFAATAVCGALITANAAHATDVTVEVTNLTNAIYFTPLMIAVHDTNVDLFEVGAPASAGLQAMAEGGATADLTTEVKNAGGQVFNDDKLLAPGETISAQFSIKRRQHLKRRQYLSIVGMLLPTNDGFAGLDAVSIPRKKGSYVFTANGYDAGTEANDELITGGGAPGLPGIPADPGGNAPGGGTGVTGADQNGTVHIHRGIVGGRTSDLDKAVHRWLNPVAHIVVTID